MPVLWAHRRHAIKFASGIGSNLIRSLAFVAISIGIKLAITTLDSIPIHRPQPQPRRPQHMCCDKAYDSDAFRKSLIRRHYRPHIRSRGEEKVALRKSPHVKARRWVNERTQSWFNRFPLDSIRRQRTFVFILIDQLSLGRWVHAIEGLCKAIVD